MLVALGLFSLILSSAPRSHWRTKNRTIWLFIVQTAKTNDAFGGYNSLLLTPKQ